MKTETRLFSAILRYWRQRRGLSQLDLAIAADVSARHVSFLETGRATPSEDMVLRLAATLAVPMRDQNDWLQAAGFAPIFSVPNPLAELGAAIDEAISRMLEVQEPFPMVVLDRRHNVLRANRGAMSLLDAFVADPAALTAEINLYKALCDERLMRPYIDDWHHIARTLISRLHRLALAKPESRELEALIDDIFELPNMPDSLRKPDFSLPSEPTLSFRLRRDDVRVSFFTAVTSFNAPQNVTLEELSLETFFPLDESTKNWCYERAQSQGARQGLSKYQTQYTADNHRRCHNPAD